MAPEINPEYEWVFKGDEKDVLAVEKLDGTNVSIVVDNGQLTSIWNRTARIPFFTKGKSFIIKGLLNSFERGYCDLPDGQHFGEWWGAGIGKRYPGAPKVFSLFNTTRWQVLKDQGFLTVCDVVPTLYEGRFDTHICDKVVADLIITGSRVWPDAKSEGIVVFHKAAGSLFKVTCENLPLS